MTQPLDLAAIQTRHETYATIHSASGVYAQCAAQESAEDVPALIAEVTRLREINGRLDDNLKRALRAAAEDPATCLSCGHLESAHDPDGERDCHASGAQFATCVCTCFIACYPAPADPEMAR